MEQKDIFINNKIYPNAKDIFNIKQEPLEEIKDKAIYVLDTNALLLPFTTSSKSIDEIKKVYTDLLKDNRLFIPGQVAREFAKNRPTKIKELYHAINEKKNVSLKTNKYPLLEEIESYQKTLELEEQINSLIDEYKKAITKVTKEIKNWTWNDPVSSTYNDLFNESTIIDIEIVEENIKKDLQERYNHKIPPGYKDKGKSDDGIGDLLVWYTILEIAKDKDSDIIFISGDEKTDWFHRSNSQRLYPRFELIAEFREKASKKSFQIIKLSDLLELHGANETIVKEIKFEEKNSLIYETDSFDLNQIISLEDIIENWIRNSSYYENTISRNTFPDIEAVDSHGETVGFTILKNPTMGSIQKAIATASTFLSTQQKSVFSKIKLIVIININSGTNRHLTEKLFKPYFNNDNNVQIIIGEVVGDMFFQL